MRIFERKIWKFRSLLFRRLCWTIRTVRSAALKSNKLLLVHESAKGNLTQKATFAAA
jgi:hypothetical protein